MIRSEQKIIGLDFNDYYAEVVQVVNKGESFVLEAYNRAIIPSDVIVEGDILLMDDLKKIISDLLRDAVPNAIPGGDVAMVLPANKVLTHVFEFPAAMKAEEVAVALPYEIEKVIPFPIDDIYYDFRILEAEDVARYHATQKVLFASVEKTVADKYLALVKSLKLTPKLFGIVPEALEAALYKKLSLSEGVLVVEVDSISASYMLVEKGILKHFFSTVDGGRKLIRQLSAETGMTEEEILDDKANRRLGSSNVLKEFYCQIYKTASSIIEDQIEKKNIRDLKKVVLTGKFFDVDEAYSIAVDHFSDYEVEIADPKESLTIMFNNEIVANDTSKVPYAIFFNHCIGATFAAMNFKGRSPINLLPTYLKKMFLDQRRVFQIKMFMIGMSFVSLFIASFVFIQYQKLSFARVELEIKKSAVENLLFGSRYQQIREQIISFNQEVDALANIDAKLFSVPDMISRIRELVPENVEITSIEYNDLDGEVKLFGVAEDRDVLLSFQRDLERAELVEDVFAPISNYDESAQISFVFDVKLNFSKLSKYGQSARQ